MADESMEEQLNSEGEAAAAHKKTRDPEPGSWN
jgi:hypothetical protein